MGIVCFDLEEDERFVVALYVNESEREIKSYVGIHICLHSVGQ